MKNKIIQEIMDYKIHARFQRASANIRGTPAKEEHHILRSRVSTGFMYLQLHQSTFALLYLDSRTNRNILQKWWPQLQKQTISFKRGSLGCHCGQKNSNYSDQPILLAWIASEIFTWRTIATIKAKIHLFNWIKQPCVIYLLHLLFLF